MLIKPASRIDLEHRAYLLRSAGNLVVAASQDGDLSILSPDLTNVRSHRVVPKIRAVSPHPSGRSLARVDTESGALIVEGLDGERVTEIAPPPVEEQARGQVRNGFEDCLFDETGGFLWLVAALNPREFEVRLVETAGWSLTDSTIVKDRFGYSACLFGHTTQPGLMAYWMAAGQDGQQLFWLRQLRDGFTCEEGELVNTTPPVYSPDGSHFLVLDEDSAVCKYDASTVEHLGWAESEDEDDPFSESLCHLDGRYALAGTNEGRVYVIDTNRMEVEEEAVVESHDPRPIGEYYPSLAHECGLATDISYFTRVGAHVVFVYRRDRRAESGDWKDSMLCYPPK